MPNPNKWYLKTYLWLEAFKERSEGVQARSVRALFQRGEDLAAYSGVATPG